ncbi:flagellar biosynthetic protein FliR [bacterium]|nr:flagellar biosynthetic protein FliR [bacterium]
MDWLNDYAWIGALLFVRIGTVLMLAPGWGETATPPTIRLAAALLATVALAPALAASAPPPPAGVGEAIPAILSEFLIGLTLGVASRIMMSSLQVAGAVVGLSSGLGFAQQLDPVANQQGAIFATFFGLMGVVLVMAAGLHRMMLEAAAESYRLFPPGSPPMFPDAFNWLLDAVSNAFRLGIQIAAPVLVFSLILNIALGFVSRLIPALQVFMIAQPLAVWLGIAVTMSGFGAGMIVWINEMERQASYFLPR